MEEQILSGLKKVNLMEQEEEYDGYCRACRILLPRSRKKYCLKCADSDQQQTPYRYCIWCQENRLSIDDKKDHCLSCSEAHKRQCQLCCDYLPSLKCFTIHGIICDFCMCRYGI